MVKASALPAKRLAQLLRIRRVRSMQAKLIAHQASHAAQVAEQSFAEREQIVSRIASGVAAIERELTSLRNCGAFRMNDYQALSGRHDAMLESLRAARAALAKATTFRAQAMEALHQCQAESERARVRVDHTLEKLSVERVRQRAYRSGRLGF